MSANLNPLTDIEYQIVYNFLSFGIAAMGAATIFFFFQAVWIHPDYRNAVIVSSLVTGIAFYHYLRIFTSFSEAYEVDATGGYAPSGLGFNDAYRYVDWLLTVPLLLMELILVMDLDEDTTKSMCIKLGSAAALMVILGYPGEISEDNGVRWGFWVAAMIPFVYIVYTLFVGLSDSISAQQPAKAADMVKDARWVTVLSWCTYPIVFLFPNLGLTGAGAQVAIQVGYTVADVIAKPILGLVVYSIARVKGKHKSTYTSVQGDEAIEAKSATSNYQAM